MSWLDSISSNMMNKSLDGLWARQQAISDNLANYETPGYQKKIVTFEEQLKAAINDTSKTNSEKIDRINKTKSLMSVVDDQTLRADDNNVDIEQENIEFARTQIHFNLVTRQLSDEFSRIRYAISGGTSR